MENLWSMLHNPVFLVCLFAGAFVVFMFSVGQFAKPSVSMEDNDPRRFVAIQDLTPRHQFLVGFWVYCGSLLLVFLAVSLLGPDNVLQIMKGSGASTPDELTALLKNFSTFPVVVAFLIMGLYPSLRLPKSLDPEIFLRRFAHRIAYIPKNMDLIFNHMRFSEFDSSQEKVDDAWNAIGLRRPLLDAPDCGSIRSLIDRTLLLYVRALNLANDGEVENGHAMMKDLSLEVFRQYRNEIENVEVSIQAVYTRLSELNGLNPAERRRSILLAQRELVKSLEFLYVIFACAITGRGMDRISIRLRALGFRSNFAPDNSVPWDPVFKSLGAAALVLAAAWLIAAQTMPNIVKNSGFPTTPPQALHMLVVILIVHMVAMVAALGLRARLIGRDNYFSEMGHPYAAAFIRLFARCFTLSLLCYLVLNIDGLIQALADTTPAETKRTPAENLWKYFYTFFVCSIVPACCGVMIAYAIERSNETRLDRLASGGIQGTVMAIAALLSVEFTVEAPPAGVRIFFIVLYGGLGLILGYMLPSAIRAHLAALEKRLPDKVAVLRTSVLQYFHNIQQFTEWLNMRNERLNGRRPIDVLAEETGLQQLTSFVAETRTRIAAADA